MSIPYLACMLSAASWYHLPPRVLPSIQAVEGGRPGLVSYNTDGSFDMGLMQINSRWITQLAHATHLSDAVIRDRLVYDACFGIAAASAIMRLYLNESHGNLIVAVGWYHSHTPSLSATYQIEVLHAATRLFERRSRTEAGAH